MTIHVTPVATANKANLVFLNPGDFHFGQQPLKLSTLLGSCVTVTLWHPARRIGGMCHFLVPNRHEAPGTEANGFSAVGAFALFDAAVRRTGSQFHEYQAKVFGGGNMFPDISTGLSIGRRNIETAQQLLKARRIPLLAEHVGGAGHRKLVFCLGSGEVRLVFNNLEKIGME